MTKATPFILLALFSISVIIWLIYYFYFRSNKIVKNFNLFAEKYGFTVDMSKKFNFLVHPVASGSFRNRNFMVGSDNKEVKGNRFSSTFIKVQCANPLNVGFLIQRRTRANKVIMSREEVLTEEKEFDIKFVVQANNCEVIKSILDYTNRYKLLQALNLGMNGTLKLNGNTLYFEEIGLLKDNIALMRIEIIIHCMCDIADDLSRQ